MSLIVNYFQTESYSTLTPENSNRISCPNPSTNSYDRSEHNNIILDTWISFLYHQVRN